MRPPSEQIAITSASANPLLRAGAPLFALVNQLRSSPSHPDPTSLQAHVAQEIVQFENSARQLGEAPEQILAARYAICTLLDESALSTPWGAESEWASRTLLVRFHNEARGGEKFFQILERLFQDPARNLHLLEFMYVCLILGFEGRYRLQPRGRAELERIQQSLFETIRNFRGSADRDLSIRWRGVEYKRPRLAQYVPLWVLAAGGAGLGLLAYVGFLFALNAQYDPVAGSLAQLARDTPPIEARAPAPVIQSTTLKDVLSSNAEVSAAIKDGLVDVEERTNSSLVRLWGMFPSGQATVADGSVGLVSRVAEGLARFGGAIHVVGHTDDQPIRSLRFPSNWILSERRAESVRSLLAESNAPERFTSEGKADTEPLVANTSAVNRALNRRVEVTLYYESGDL